MFIYFFTFRSPNGFLKRIIRNKLAAKKTASYLDGFGSYTDILNGLGFEDNGFSSNDILVGLGSQRKKANLSRHRGKLNSK